MINQTEALKTSLTRLLSSKKIACRFPFFDCYGPSINAVVGRPGSNKTAILDLIIEDVMSHPDNKIVSAIYHQLELPIFEIFKRKMLRDEYIMSFDETITRDVAEKFYLQNKNKDIYYVDYSYTVSEFYNSTIQWVTEKGISLYNMGLVAVDHMLLFPSYELDNLFKAFVELKKKGCIIIVLSQLNRNIEDQQRKSNGSFKNIINPGDIYSSDKLYHYCDLIIAADMPYNRNITLWGPNNIPVGKTDIIISHLKNRNGIKRYYLSRQVRPYMVDVIREIEHEEIYGVGINKEETNIGEETIAEEIPDTGDIISDAPELDF